MSGPLSASKKSMAIPAGIASIRLVASPIGGFSTKLSFVSFKVHSEWESDNSPQRKSHPKTIRP
ncbi:hypothetical protein DPMN_027639 [Dreissena polymorpha]|uniref:Uncharacterized protein n=1 Tax=Dreissena polymorpha TaxID=45954 RepID=A0A9D4RDM7_DREPO|nr:hypothetical protein DPMN_027639 [Dreissena polymorpha]